jgi:Mg-chelatase subunit ChlD
LDVIFVVDASTSVGQKNWDKTLDFLDNLVKRMNIAPDGTHAALIQFGNLAQIIWEFNAQQKENELRSAILKVPYLLGLQKTNIADGFEKAENILKSSSARPGITKLVFLVTDGIPTVLYFYCLKP